MRLEQINNSQDILELTPTTVKRLFSAKPGKVTSRLPKIHLELGLQIQYENIYVSCEGLCHIMEAGYSHIHL